MPKVIDYSVPAVERQQRPINRNYNFLAVVGLSSAFLAMLQLPWWYCGAFVIFMILKNPMPTGEGIAMAVAMFLPSALALWLGVIAVVRARTYGRIAGALGLAIIFSYVVIAIRSWVF